MAEPAEEHRRITPIPRSRLSIADQGRLIHVAYAERGTTKEDLLDPEYWKMVAPQLNPNDRIEVYCEAQEFFGIFIVMQRGQNAAIVRNLEWYDLTKGRQATMPTGDPSQDYEVKWGNMHTKWRVLRVSDGAVIKDQCPDELTAEREKADYIKALGK